jgi:hypothetical protein
VGGRYPAVQAGCDQAKSFIRRVIERWLKTGS